MNSENNSQEKPQAPRPDGWVTAEEVAAHLQLSLGYVRKLTQQGALPHIRIGRRIRYRVSAVDEWMATGDSTREV